MRLIIALFLWLSVSSAQAQMQHFESAQQRTALVELYTSEGCSSCPPADRWLSGLQQHKDLWRTFVPIAFHVDYWDYIGWPDRFADPRYSQRQRQYAQQHGERVVYTPGVRRAGDEWRFWRFADDPGVSEGPAVGQLSVQVAKTGAFTAAFTPASDLISAPLQLTVAILGMDLETSVERGENRGRTLHHDFVVLAQASFSSSDNRWQADLPVSAINAPQYALAAWISSPTSLTPLQATGGFLR